MTRKDWLIFYAGYMRDQGIFTEEEYIRTVAELNSRKY